MKVAIVHDWLVGMRGGEKCLEVLCLMYPEADIFTLIHNKKEISPQINSHNIFPSKLQKLPGVRKFYRYLLPIMPLVAKEVSRKLSDYDLVISISHCFAKNIRVPEGVPHICYCLSPMRYIWDQYDSYFKGRSIEPLVRPVAGMLRKWDRGAEGVTRLVAISEFVQKRIERCYGLESEVIYPPVDCAAFGSETLKEAKKKDNFLVVNALVPYKNTHVVVEAFRELDLPLVVVGRGPEAPRIHQLAGPRTSFKSFVSEQELRMLYRTSRAMVFAAEEDFGITPVENQAAGRPVIALGKGGALETVEEDHSGLFFEEVSVDQVKAAVKKFMANESQFKEKDCVNNSAKFSLSRFQKDFSELVVQVMGQKNKSEMTLGKLTAGA